MPYSRFETLLEQGQITEAYIRPDRLKGRLKTPLKNWRPYFVATQVDPQLADRLAAQKVACSWVVESTFLRDLLF